MNQNQVLQSYNKLIELRKYKKALDLIVTYFDSIDDDIVVNVVRYWELLINKNQDVKYRSWFIEPLSKYLNKRIPSLDDYVLVSREINRLSKIAMHEFENEIKTYYSYPYHYSIFTILSKYEVYYHRIMNQVLDSIGTDAFSNEQLNEASTSMIQMSVESLSYIIKLIMDRKNEFSNNYHVSKSKFVAAMIKADKKTSSPHRLVDKVNALLYIEMLRNMNIKYDLKLDRDNNLSHFEYKDYTEFKKKRIAQLRLENFEKNEQRLFDYDESDLDVKGDFSKIIKINEAGKSFVLEFNLVSDEFLEVLQDTYYNFNYAVNQIYRNNYLRVDFMNRNIRINSSEIDASFKDAINFYFALESLARFYYKGIEYYKMETGHYPITSVMVTNSENLHEAINQFYNIVMKDSISTSKFNDLIKIFTYGQNSIYDLYYKPLIKNDSTITIIPSVFKHNMFHRTFLNHMNKIDPSYKSGDVLEEYVKNYTKNFGFKVYDRESPALNFELDNGKNGDIDILMKEDRFIFYGQIKNRMTPMDREDFTSFNRKIKKTAANQLKHADEFLRSNPAFILEELEITDVNQYELVPFILTNSFYGSGDLINDIPIVDVSSFNRFLRKEDIKIFDGTSEASVKEIYDDNLSIGENFFNYINKPYFLDEKLYHSLYYGSYYDLKNHRIALSCNNEIQVEKVTDSYIETYLRSL